MEGIEFQLTKEGCRKLQIKVVIVIKRAIDILISLVGMIILLPILILIWASIRLFIGSPAMFYQSRPGKDFNTFKLVKFRSMVNAFDLGGTPLPDHLRLTRFGRALRRYSLDEIPQLLNVLKGDMSLVGPRPLLERYKDRYSPEQARRQTVKPGITGWAQVNGRNAISWEQKFELDVWYVEHHSLWLDLKILGMTLLKVIHSDGISAAGEATTSEFMGSPPKD